MLTFALILLFAPQDPPEQRWDGSSLVGDWGGVRPSLAERGVTDVMTFTGEVLSNVSGGIQRETASSALLDWVIDADLQKLMGWSAASARVNPMFIEGMGITDDHVGDLMRVSNIDARDGVRLFEAWLQQGFFDDFCTIRGGIIAWDQEFGISPSRALFVNSTFGTPVVFSSNHPVPVYPVASTGIRLRVEPMEGVYVQGAVYDGDPGSEDFNRTGLKLRYHDGEGTLTAVEAGWTHSKGLEGVVKAGAQYHSQHFDHFESGDRRSGLLSLYVMAEQRIFREPGPEDSAEGLSVFFFVGGAPRDRALVTFYADLGATYTGLIPGRDEDVFGLAVVYARLSPEFADVQIDPGHWDHELYYEATYKVVFSPWLSLQPFVTAIVHPGGSSAVDDAWILGLRTDILF